MGFHCWLTYVNKITDNVLTAFVNVSFRISHRIKSENLLVQHINILKINSTTKNTAKYRPFQWTHWWISSSKWKAFVEYFSVRPSRLIRHIITSPLYAWCGRKNVRRRLVNKQPNDWRSRLLTAFSAGRLVQSLLDNPTLVSLRNCFFPIVLR